MYLWEFDFNVVLMGLFEFSWTLSFKNWFLLRKNCKLRFRNWTHSNCKLTPPNYFFFKCFAKSDFVSIDSGIDQSILIFSLLFTSDIYGNFWKNAVIGIFIADHQFDAFEFCAFKFEFRMASSTTRFFDCSMMILFCVSLTHVGVNDDDSSELISSFDEHNFFAPILIYEPN